VDARTLINTTFCLCNYDVLHSEAVESCNNETVKCYLPDLYLAPFAANSLFVVRIIFHGNMLIDISFRA